MGLRSGAGTETLSSRDTPSLRDGVPSRAGALGGPRPLSGGGPLYAAAVFIS
jgi:hypothetical protein